MHLVLVLATCAGQPVAGRRPVAVDTAPLPTAADTAVADSATPWGGDYFPNTLLTNQDGRQVRFSMT
jgi:hypothetical protein